MEENKNTARLFHVEIAQGIYLISDPEQGPTEDGKSLAPGNATANSYLIIGEERAVLLDLAVNSPELKTYAEKLAGIEPWALRPCVLSEPVSGCLDEYKR